MMNKLTGKGRYSVSKTCLSQVASLRLFWISHSIKAWFSPQFMSQNRKLCHSLLTLMSFHPCMAFLFLLWSSKQVVIFHKMETNSNHNYLVTNVFQNISFCFPQKKESDSVLGFWQLTDHMFDFMEISHWWMWVRKSSLALAELIRLNVTRLEQFDIHKQFSHNDQVKHLIGTVLNVQKNYE